MEWRKRGVKEEWSGVKEEWKEEEAPVLPADINAETGNHTEILSGTEAVDAAEDLVPKSDVTCEPMEVAEEESEKMKAVDDMHVPSLASPLSAPSPCPFLTQATPDSYLEYPLPPPAKKNTRSSQMVVLKHSSPKPPRKMSKKVASAPQTPGLSEPPLQPPAVPCKLLLPPKIDPTECIPMQEVESAGALSSCSESPSCASVNEPPRLPALDLSAPTLSAAALQESHSAPMQEETHPTSQPCESSPDARPRVHTPTHSHAHVQTHTYAAAERQPSLHRDQNTQTEPLPLEALQSDAPKPIIQVNSQPFVQVDEPTPKMHPDALVGSLSQQTNNVPIATDATDVHPTRDVSEPHLSGQPKLSDSQQTEGQSAEMPSEVSDISCVQLQTDTPQPNTPQCTCEAVVLPVPSVSSTATVPPPAAEMPVETPEVNAMWPLPSDPFTRRTEVPPQVTSSPPPPPPPPQGPPMPTVTVVAESMYGDFEQAMDHLRYRLIATRNPEEIRGGGLLKYSNLLVREFKPASETEIKTLERYMCSRFFIDFPDVNEQQRKIESYLRNHFIGEEKSKYDYLMTLRRVVDESTVCLMGHERRQTLNMITILALKVLGEQNIIPNTSNVTCFYQPAPYMTDHNFSNYYIANGQSPVIYHPYPLHIHMQTGLV